MENRKLKKKYTKNKNTKKPPSSNAMSLETVLRMVSAAAVSLLLLVALFMQVSGVSLTLTWPSRLCLLRVLLCGSHCYKLSPFQAHWGR
jgi:hypothetical protein